MKKQAKTNYAKVDFRWRGLTTQLFLLLVLPLTAVALIVIFASLRLHQGAMRALVGERDQLAAGATASALGAEFSHRSTSLQGFALRVAESGAPPSVLANSAYLLNDFDAGLAVISADGDLVVASFSLFPWAELLQRKELFDFASIPVPAVEPLFFSLADFPEPGDFYLLAISSVDSRSPMVAGAFSISFAEGIIAQAFPSRVHTGISLVDTAHQIVYQTGATNPEMDALQRGIDSALAGDTGAENASWQDQEYVIAYAPVEPIGWAFVIQESWESIESPILRTTQTAPLFLVPIIIFALLALWFEARQIVRPLQSLQEKAAALSWGEFDKVKDPVGGIEEIRRLQNELVHMSAKVQRAQRGLRGYIGAIVAGQEEERLRLSNELHDETIQSLIVLNQRVQLALLSTKDQKSVAEMQRLQATIDETIKDLRGIIRGLRPPYLEDLGLAASLDMLCRDSATAFKIPVDFKLSGRESRLKPDAELALYRIAQEALNNVNRHANATRSFVELGFQTDQVTLAVRDNGKGFNLPDSPAEFAPAGHYGFLGMHEKAEQIGAIFQVSSTPRKGTEISVSLSVSTSSNRKPTSRPRSVEQDLIVRRRQKTYKKQK